MAVHVVTYFSCSSLWRKSGPVKVVKWIGAHKFKASDSQYGSHIWGSTMSSFILIVCKIFICFAGPLHIDSWCQKPNFTGKGLWDFDWIFEQFVSWCLGKPGTPIHGLVWVFMLRLRRTYGRPRRCKFPSWHSCLAMCWRAHSWYSVYALLIILMWHLCILYIAYVLPIDLSLLLQVRRSSLFSDSLRQLVEHECDFKKPLKVLGLFCSHSCLWTEN